VLVAIGSNGRVYTVPVAQLPSARGDGAPVTSMIELESGTRLVGYVAGLETHRGHRARRGKMVDSKLKPPYRLAKAGA
jgi:DNA gyrase/topoisomerase IV subunit A